MRGRALKLVIVLFIIGMYNLHTHILLCQEIHAFYFIATTNEVSKENIARNVDLLKARQTVKEIAKAIGYTIPEDNVIENKYTFKGVDCSRAGLERAFSSFHCTDNDIVVFYYSGHGQCTKNEEDKLPVLNMIYRGGDYHVVPLRVVIEKLKTCGAHLAFVITDCCNESYYEYDEEWSIGESEGKNTKDSSHCMIVAITASGQGTSTLYNGYCEDEKYSERLVRGELNSYEKKEGLPLGSWFTEILCNNILNMLHVNETNKKNTRVSLTSLIDVISHNLDDFVCGYNYLKRIRKESDMVMKYAPYYEIIYN